MHHNITFLTFVLMSLLMVVTVSNSHLLPGRELTEKRMNRNEYRKALRTKLLHHVASKEKFQWIDKVIQVSQIGLLICLIVLIKPIKVAKYYEGHYALTQKGIGKCKQFLKLWQEIYR